MFEDGTSKRSDIFDEKRHFLMFSSTSDRVIPRPAIPRLERIAALLKNTPFVPAFNDALALHYSISQILKIYPNAREIVLPYLLSVDVVAGLIGAWNGRQAILNPNQPPTTQVRCWKATTRGLAVFVFTLGDAIKIYIMEHPGVRYVSNTTFWGEIASAPLSLFALHAGWHSISPTRKERWFPQDSRLNYVRMGIDAFSKLLYYSRVFQITLLNFYTPNNLLYQIIPLIPALMVIAGQYLTRYKETLESIMTGLTAAMLGQMFVEDYLPGHDQTHINDSLSFGRIGFWGAMLLGSTYFAWGHRDEFVSQYQGDPDVAVIEQNPDTGAVESNLVEQLSDFEPGTTTTENFGQRESPALTWMAPGHQAYAVGFPGIDTGIENSGTVQINSQRRGLGHRDSSKL